MRPRPVVILLAAAAAGTGIGYATGPGSVWPDTRPSAATAAAAGAIAAAVRETTGQVCAPQWWPTAALQVACGAELARTLPSGAVPTDTAPCTATDLQALLCSRLDPDGRARALQTAPDIYRQRLAVLQSVTR